MLTLLASEHRLRAEPRAAEPERYIIAKGTPLEWAIGIIFLPNAPIFPEGRRLVCGECSPQGVPMSLYMSHLAVDPGGFRHRGNQKGPSHSDSTER